MNTMKTKQLKSKLTYSLISRPTLEAFEIHQMFHLMEANYDHVSQEQFIEDLEKKQWVGLLRDEEGVIQGFTTFVINPGGTGTSAYNIIFLGDTIISPAYWGSFELIKGGMRTGGQMVASEPHKKWYWLLISKGHRTYMYLPLFFKDYYPRSDENHSDPLYSILDDSCKTLFGDSWKKEKGLVIFPKSMGQLKPELAAATWQKKRKPQVAFFLKKNPGFHLGHELACLTEASPDNLRGFAQRYFMEGMRQPLMLGQ